MTDEPELTELAEVPTAVVDGQIAMSDAGAFFDRVFRTLPGVLAEQGIGIVGPAVARYHGAPTDTVDLEAGFPTDRPVTAAGDVRPGSLPSGTAARLVHAGGYDSLGESWGRLAGWLAEHGHTPGDDLWEVYVTEPTPDMDPADLRTELYWRLA